MKLLIVDDDAIIRQALVKIVTQSDLPVTAILEAADGEEGLQAAFSDSPDLIITDIRMPKMDGLTFLENVYQRLPDTKLVILTGYDEFDYAKQAIRFGVSEYLLKPYDNAELLTTLRNMFEIIAQEKKLRDQHSVFSLFYLENLDTQNERNIEAYFESGGAVEASVLSDSLTRSEPRSNYVVLIVAVDSAASVSRTLYENDAPLMHYAVKNILDEILTSRFAFVSCRLARGGLAVLLRMTGREQEEALRFDIEKLRYFCKKHLSHTVTVWVSSGFENLGELALRFDAAKKGIHQRLFTGGNVVLRESRLKSRLRDFALETQQQNQLLSAIHKGDEAAVAKWIDDVIVPLAPRSELNAFSVKHAIARLCLLLYLENGPRGSSLAQAHQSPVQNDWIWDSETFVELLTAFRKVCRNLMEEQRKNCGENTQNRAIQQAILFIKEHFSGEITLESLAEQVWLHPAYLSELFKKELGINFTDYLAQVRIEQAQAYLSLKRYKIAEVASMVGYANAEYFARVFKKIVGITPREFQDRSV